MKCEKVLRQLEDFHYGELAERTAAELRAHLAACDPCRSASEEMVSEDKRYEAYAEGLDRTLEVEPQMWQRIRARIEDPSQPGKRRLAEFVAGLLPHGFVPRQAAYAMVLVLFSVGVTLLGVHYYRIKSAGSVGMRTSGDTAVVAREGGPQTGLEAALRAIERAEAEYINAIEVLNKIVDKRKPTLDPQLVAEVEKNLKAIDESIAATRNAYHAHPSDPDLAHYMLLAYEKKVELLLELAS